MSETGSKEAVLAKVAAWQWRVQERLDSGVDPDDLDEALNDVLTPDEMAIFYAHCEAEALAAGVSLYLEPDTAGDVLAELGVSALPTLPRGDR